VYKDTDMASLNMNTMNFFNIVYKMKKAKTEKSGVVDRLKWHIFK